MEQVEPSFVQVEYPYVPKGYAYFVNPEEYFIDGRPVTKEDFGAQDEMTRENILEEAHKIVTQDRNLDYGAPEDNFKDIADMMTVLFSDKLKEGCFFVAHDVAMAMICVKLSRLKTSPGKRDHWVDIVGYAACGGQAWKKPS